MIRGIGTDIVEIARIAKAIRRERFLFRVFSEEEINRYGEKGCRAETLAGCFAAKEAFAKALGTGFRGFSFCDISVQTDDMGKPCLILSKKLKSLPCTQGISAIHLSISHSNENAIAFVILEE